MRAYSKENLLAMLDQAFRSPSTLYKQPFVNYRGKTANTGEKYTEVLAESILHNIARLHSIPIVTRSSSYKVKGHNGSTDGMESNREEERIALSMFGKTYNFVGEILDYQVPLKNSSQDEGLGKIDLLSYNGKCLRLLELKRPGSAETLLRCILEVLTYRRIIDAAKLLRDYGLTDDTLVRSAILVFSDCVAYKEYRDDMVNENTKRLMDALDIELFVLDGNSIDVVNIQR